MTTITRQNWREHTTAPPLTADELAAVRAANERLGWLGMAVWADALRRLQRAELKAWEEMK